MRVTPITGIICRAAPANGWMDGERGKREGEVRGKRDEWEENERVRGLKGDWVWGQIVGNGKPKEVKSEENGWSVNPHSTLLPLLPLCPPILLIIPFEPKAFHAAAGTPVDERQLA